MSERRWSSSGPLEQTPQPTGRAMTTDAHAELYRVLLDSAELAPLNVLAQQIEVLATVLARRLNDEMGEFTT